jgi:hypothetical protein
MLFSLLECRRPNYWHDDQYGWWLDRDVIKISAALISAALISAALLSYGD